MRQCSDCELESASIHDPSHAFLRLTHRLRRPLPSLNSGLVPLLYLPKQDGHEARAEGKENGVVASRDQAGGTTQEGGKHAMIVCDACGQKITDAWMLCCKLAHSGPVPIQQLMRAPALWNRSLSSVVRSLPALSRRARCVNPRSPQPVPRLSRLEGAGRPRAAQAGHAILESTTARSDRVGSLLVTLL